MTGTPSIAVIICTYTDLRWDLFTACVTAVREQAKAADAKVIVVVDHNDELHRRCAAALPGVTVLANRGARGLSGARNTGVEESGEDVVLFIDDDAIPQPGWLTAMRTAFTDPALLGAGGEVRPVWPDGTRPLWLPPEFDWVVGCDYIGMADLGAQMRNPIGANMGLRRSAVIAAGGFRATLGRIGRTPAGCEETDLCIRMKAATPTGLIRRIPGAPVHHHIDRDRCHGRYLIRRCYAEGGSKAVLTRLEGASQAMSAEAGHALVTIPRAVAAELAATLRGDTHAPRRILWTALGLTAAVLGWLVGTVRSSGAAGGSRADGLRPFGIRARAVVSEPATITTSGTRTAVGGHRPATFVTRVRTGLVPRRGTTSNHPAVVAPGTRAEIWSTTGSSEPLAPGVVYCVALTSIEIAAFQRSRRTPGIAPVSGGPGQPVDDQTNRLRRGDDDRTPAVDTCSESASPRTGGDTVQVDQPINSTSAAAGEVVHLLVRVDGRPLGRAEVRVAPELEPGTQLRSAAVGFAVPRLDSIDAAPVWPRARIGVCVVICTLGRAATLPAAVRSVLVGQSVPVAELIVVDNDPGSGRVARALAGFDDSRLRIVGEARRGVSRARNAGIVAAQAPVIAFTDDDVEAEPDWIERLAEVFEADTHREIACVTGLVVPADLGFVAHRWFEFGSGFERGHTVMVWEPGADAGLLDRLREYEPLAVSGRRGPAYPVAGSEFGSGNNMALRREWLLRAGGFDIVLGTGSPARGGEDLDMFRRTILDGGAIVYQPAAVVRHHHRDTVPQLRRQMYDYGVGMCASVLRYATTDRRSLLRVARAAPAGMRLLLDPRSDKNSARTADYPRALTCIELAGYLTAPAHLARSRFAARRRHAG